jgi:hypothetical protein
MRVFSSHSEIADGGMQTDSKALTEVSGNGFGTSATKGYADGPK